MALDMAEMLAHDLVIKLRDWCVRIETAGSVRRRKSEVGDIEIVCIPKFVNDMFGNPTTTSVLDVMDWSNIGVPEKSGPKYKQIILRSGAALDLFIVTPPAQFGVQFLIRTGPAEYSHRFVTPKHYGGMLPSNLKVKDGAIWKGNQLIETPEEEDVFNLIGAPWIPPMERK